MSTPHDSLLQEQIGYYRARSSEYDEWFLRTGRYDHGPELNGQWFAEVGQVSRALAAFDPKGRVLELACGTGIWTEQLARYADSITAVDSSPEMLAITRKRVGEGKVELVQADLFAWQPEGKYDVVFFSFWLSHVPPERFAGFWEMVRGCLAPGGRVFFIDSAYSQTSTAHDHQLQGQEATTLTRRLNDGQEFRIYKVFYRPHSLTEALAQLGWQASIEATPNYFIYGSAQPVSAEGGGTTSPGGAQEHSPTA